MCPWEFGLYCSLCYKAHFGASLWKMCKLGDESRWSVEMEMETPKSCDKALRSCDCLCWHLLYCFFFYSFITAMLCCLKRHLLSKPAFPPDGDAPDFLFILNFGFTLRWEAGCCCVSCSISVIRPVSLHGCGSSLAHWSRLPHLIILTCDSPRPLFTPAVPHSLVSSVWFESTSTKTPTFTSVVHLILGGGGIKFSAILVPFLHHTGFFFCPNLLMSW